MRKTIPAFAATASERPVSGPAGGSKGRAIPMKSEVAYVGNRVRVRQTVKNSTGPERLEIGRVKRGPRKEVRIHGDASGRISKPNTTQYYKKALARFKRFPVKVLRST